MPTETPRALLDLRYHHAAQEYARNLPLEHYMEATSQSKQRAITLASLALVHADWPEFQVFNELLVQYPLRGQKRPGQVVPDNMVVVHDQPIKAEGSFDVPLQPAGPILMLEYVSKNSKRKDYDDNMEKYERHLKVPYYLLFQPDIQAVSVYRHNSRRFVSVKPDQHGRYAMLDLQLEAALVERWVRFWYKGKLLPLPGELKRELEAKDRQLKVKDRQIEVKDRQIEASEQARRVAEEETAQLRAELEQLKKRRNHHS